VLFVFDNYDNAKCVPIESAAEMSLGRWKKKLGSAIICFMR